MACAAAPHRTEAIASRPSRDRPALTRSPQVDGEARARCIIDAPDLPVRGPTGRFLAGRNGRHGGAHRHERLGERSPGPGGLDDRLGGNATGVGALAAETVALDEQRPSTGARCRETGGTTPDDDEVAGLRCGRSRCRAARHRRRVGGALRRHGHVAIAMAVDPLLATPWNPDRARRDVARPRSSADTVSSRTVLKAGPPVRYSMPAPARAGRLVRPTALTAPRARSGCGRASPAFLSIRWQASFGSPWRGSSARAC